MLDPDIQQKDLRCELSSIRKAEAWSIEEERYENFNACRLSPLKVKLVWHTEWERHEKHLKKDFYIYLSKHLAFKPTR